MANIIFWSGIFTPETTLPLFAGKHITRPIASYQLSWWLRQHRFSSQVVEFLQILTKQELIDLTEPFIKKDTLAIGISTVFWPVDGSIPKTILEAVDYFKSKYPKLKFIGGGNRSSRLEYSPLGFDQTFLNDGENDLLKYMQELKYSVKMPNQQFDITQLEHRFIRSDVILENEVLPIELGRGCIFRCKFCNYTHIGKKKHTYQRKFDYIVDELKYNKDTFNTNNYLFLDDTVNEDMEKVRNMGTFSKRLGFDINWIGYLRADLIHRYPESAELLKESGLLSTFFGIETFHPKASTVIGKGWNGKKAKDWLPILYNDLWNKEINIYGNFILGLPHEPIESYIKTFEWCKTNDFGQWNFYPLTLKVYNEEESLKSEFDKNYQQYGYEVFPRNIWKLGDITYHLAEKYAAYFNRVLFNNSRLSGFGMANIINLGAGTDQISDMSINDVFKFWTKDKTAEFKLRYIKQYKDLINHE